MKNLIEFPIGDWSGDGHDKCEKFYATRSDDVTIEQVREAHFASKKLFGITVEDFCDRYEDNTIKATDLEKLVEHGFIKKSDDGLFFHVESPVTIDSNAVARYGSTEGYEFGEDYNETDGTLALTPECVFRLWIAMLNRTNPALKLEIQEDIVVKRKELETIVFYGFDAQQRHIGHVGYGCFWG